jgi:hypothetical protein
MGNNPWTSTKEKDCKEMSNTILRGLSFEFDPFLLSKIKEKGPARERMRTLADPLLKEAGYEP